MHRKACVCCGIGLVLMSAALACSQPAEPQEQPAEQTQAETLTVSPAATDEVKLTVVCPPDEANTMVPLRIVVAPPYKAVDPGHDVTWTRNKLGPGTHSATFSINPVDQDNWPWTNTQDFPWTGDTEIVGTAKEDQERDAKKYTIIVGCNGDTTTIDPRMRVR